MIQYVFYQLNNMEGNYILTDKFITIYSHEKNCKVKLYRIKAIRSFGNVKVGDLGGFIESENNLAQYWTCWVYDNAMVYDNARVYGNAKICNNARVCNHAKVYDNAIIEDNALIAINAQVYENARVSGSAVVTGNAEIYGHAKLYHNSKARADVKLCDWDKVFNDDIAEDKSYHHKHSTIGKCDNHWCERHTHNDLNTELVITEMIMNTYETYN